MKQIGNFLVRYKHRGSWDCDIFNADGNYVDADVPVAWHPDQFKSELLIWRKSYALLKRGKFTVAISWKKVMKDGLVIGSSDHIYRLCEVEAIKIEKSGRHRVLRCRILGDLS